MYEKNLKKKVKKKDLHSKYYKDNINTAITYWAASRDVSSSYEESNEMN